MVSSIGGIIFDGLMVFAPVLGYIPQYKTIKKNHSPEGFSTKVSLILLLSNIMRCIFWLGKRFETSLLLQSIVMIIAQLAMLELCVRLTTRNNSFLTKKKTFLEDPFNLSHFWDWDDFPSFLIFLSLFSGFLLLVSGTMGLENTWYWELLGTVALTTESTLGIPQVLNNQKSKSTKGLSLELIASWLIGDLFKTVYFLFKGAPFQFLLCGTVQVAVDLVICFQIYSFRSRQ